jgi:hypothetical protein
VILLEYPKEAGAMWDQITLPYGEFRGGRIMAATTKHTPTKITLCNNEEAVTCLQKPHGEE